MKDEHDRAAAAIVAICAEGTELSPWHEDRFEGVIAAALREAEQRGQNAAVAPLLNARVAAAVAAERERVAAWLRTTPRAAGVLISIEHSDTLARLADDLSTPMPAPAQAERVSEEGKAEARPFHIGAEVEVIALPQRQEDGKWSRWVRTTITGGPCPHPGGSATTWGVPLDCGYRFEDEMRWPAVLRSEADALEQGALPSDPA